MATTANAIGLGNTGLFSASEPQTSNLLAINPSAFFYNRFSNQGQIVNRSTATTTVLGTPTSGLQVADGRSLLLVGGNISLEGGRLFALSGRIELGGVAQNGTVELTTNGNELRLGFPTDVARADVSLTNEAEVNVRDGGDGSIAINARNVEVLGGSKLRAGIASGLGSPESKAGDIDVNATGTMTVAGELSFLANAVLPEGVGKAGDINITTGSLFIKEGGYFNSSTYGQGDAGSLTINARDTVSFDGTDPNGETSGVVSLVTEEAVGNGGNINITTGSLFVTNDAELVAGTAGKGNAGSVRIRASDTVRFDGGDAASSVDAGAVGNGGDIEINTGLLEVTKDASLIASTFGQGNAGSVRISATDAVRFDRGDALSSVGAGAVGDGGDIEVTTGSLEVTNGAQLNVGTAGRGDAGSVKISAIDTVRFDGVSSNGFPSAAFSDVEAGAVGDSGGIEITTGSLSVSNGAFLSASTAGQGKAGSVRISATDTVSFDRGNALSAVVERAVGDGGDLEITTGSLSVSNDAFLSASTDGQGKAGSVRISATDTVRFDGGGAGSEVAEGAVGDGGDIEITTGSLTVTNNAGLAGLSSGTSGQGNAGSIRIRASDTVRFDGGNAFSSVGLGGVGSAGDLEITTGSLSVSNGAFLSASTDGQGKAGSVRIHASDTVRFDGGSTLSSVGEEAVGNAGDIEITTGSLFVTNGALLIGSTIGQGNAGAVRINATDTVSFDRGGASSFVGPTGVGDGGDIEITTGSLSITNGATLIADTIGQGNAGNIKITAIDRVRFAGVGNNGQFSGAFSAVGVGGQGKGGDIEITSGSFSLTDAVISSISQGTGAAGDITLQTRQNLETNRSSILATTQAGDGGNIRLRVGDLLLMRNDSNISTTAGVTGAGGDGGNININAGFAVAVPVEDSDITANAFNGRGGNINITAQGIYGLTFQERDIPASSDITASSQFGVDGEFQLDLLTNVDPSRGLGELPSDVVDATRQIDNRCTSTADAKSSFVVTGRGGLPSSPNEVLQGESFITNWVTLDSEAKNTSGVTPQTNLIPRTPKQLVEAQTWVYGANGEVILTAQAPTVIPHKSWSTSPSCDAVTRGREVVFNYQSQPY